MNTSVQMGREALLKFTEKYGVTFTRETFSLSQIIDGRFTLKPENGDPLPPIGCTVKVYDYDGHTFNTVVIGVDEFAGTYTAVLV